MYFDDWQSVIDTYHQQEMEKAFIELTDKDRKLRINQASSFLSDIIAGAENAVSNSNEKV